MSLITRLSCTILAGAAFLGGFSALGKIFDRLDESKARRKEANELRSEVAVLLRERAELKAAHQRELSQAYDWVSKSAIPHDQILDNAKRDAVAKTGLFSPDHCFASAKLVKDGWEVVCWTDSCMAEPIALIYVLDPLTGKILSKRVQKGSLQIDCTNK
jgi:hypothetical protein